MRTFASLDELRASEFEPGSVVAIGKFDGVHLGHQAILERMRRVAHERELEAVVFTFSNHPLSQLRPEQCPLPLMSRAQRLAAFEQAGAAACVMVEFDEEFASIPAETFVQQVLVSGLGAQHVVLGSDFRFGRGGAGNAELLRRSADKYGFSVEEVPSVDDPELGRVSSTRVREAISQGEVARAARLLGHPAAVRGDVVHGDARGRELGFPTANLGGTIEGLVPADGVYAGFAMLDGNPHEAAISVGTNPTFTEDGQPRVEAYLLDFSGDLYGQRLEVQFVQRIRGMYTFANAEALVERMHQDVADARELLAAAATP